MHDHDRDRDRDRPQRPGDELPDDCKLYIAGLAPSFDDDALKAVFSPFGPVLHAAVIKDPGTGLPRYGFVHYPDSSSARAAADGMHGKILCDDGQQRMLTVKLRSERHQQQAGPMHHAYDESKLYVAFLPDSATEGEIRSLFAGVAPVAQVRLIVDKATGLTKGYAFVTMASKEAAATAMQQLDGYQWGESQLSVRIAGDKGGPRRPPGPSPGGPRPMMPYVGGGPPPYNPNPHMQPPPQGYGAHQYGGQHAMYQPAPSYPLSHGAPQPAYGPTAAAYGALPPGYSPGPAYPGAPPPAGYGPAPPLPPQYGGAAGYAPPPTYGAPGMPAPPYGGSGTEHVAAAPPPLPGQPPLPSSAPNPPLPSQPPLPSEPSPPAPPQMTSEYERFMSEMGLPPT
jgi:hypothetical protein